MKHSRGEGKINILIAFADRATLGDPEPARSALGQRNELQMDEPDPSSFVKMARRVEGLSANELKVIALIDNSLSKISMASTSAPSPRDHSFPHNIWPTTQAMETDLIFSFCKTP